MPRFTFSRELAANEQDVDPLEKWQYRYAPYAAAVKLLIRAELVGAVMAVFSGSTTIQQRSPVPAGGAVGVPPTDFDVTAVTWVAAAGDLITLSLTETAGTTPYIDGSVEIEPL